MAKRTSNRRQALYQRLNAAFPLAFPLDDAAIQPPARSTRDDVSAWIAQQGFDPCMAKALLGAVQQQGSRRTYQATVVTGAMRINLHGEPVEPATPEGEAHAQQKIAAILAKRAAKEPRLVKMPTVKAPEPELVAQMPTVIVKKRRKVVLPS